MTLEKETKQNEFHTYYQHLIEIIFNFSVLCFFHLAQVTIELVCLLDMIPVYCLM